MGIVLFFSLALRPAFAITGIANGPGPVEIQRMIKSNLARAYAASVFLYDYDTVAKRIVGPRFSGVVVTSSGVIMTAGHASRTGKAYMVAFPNDKKEYVAIGLGRIASFDAALVQIKAAGEFPFAEMGWSSSLQVNEPCMSIAYPGSFHPKKLVVRFGYIAEIINGKRQMLRSTCLMEPGDSGGPVFDLSGRVIGIRSNITQGLQNNYDVPVDVFRSYWSALLKPEDYQFLPKADPVAIDPLAKQKLTFKSEDQLSIQLSAMESKLEKYSVQLMNGADSSFAVGTLVDLHKLIPKKANPKKTFVISKNSLIRDGVIVKMGVTQIGTRILYRDQQSDLVLLELDKEVNGGLDAAAFSADTLTISDLGNILISPNPAGNGHTSVIGSLEFTLPKMFSGGYLGLSFGENSEKKLIVGVQDKSPANRAGLKIGDEILSINGIDVPNATMFSREVQKNSPEEIVKIRYQRNGESYLTDVKLGRRPQNVSAHVAEQFLGGKSARFDGFNHAFVHDATLLPSECGGPVFDLNGNFRGINMARYSRTSSIATSPAEIASFIKTALTHTNS